MALTKNDLAWQKLFEEHDILREVDKKDYYIITANDIGKYRESRLMTKFDHKANLPKLFKDNSLTILPISRGSYIIGRFENYQKLEYRTENNVRYKNFPFSIETLDYNNIYSESAAISCATLAGMVEDLINEELYMTVFGRMTTDLFAFKINTDIGNLFEVEVDRAQMEIDAGFESENYFLILEAKNIRAEDFLIRQLYYPYRYWQNKVQKKVIPVFMTYSNDIFSFFIYEFREKDHYNSLELIEQRHYSIEPEKITYDDLYELYRRIKTIAEPKVPFPQADSFYRVLDFLHLLYNEDLTKEELALNYEFDIHKRQFDYYINAARYLGLVYKYNAEISNEVTYSLTEKGRNIMSQPREKRNLMLAESIMEHEVFNKAMNIYFRKKRIPGKEEIIHIMNNSYLYRVNSDETIIRRAQTVLKWIEWIVSLVE